MAVERHGDPVMVGGRMDDRDEAAWTVRRLLATVSAFTVGHSVTLTLAAELARRPVAPTLMRRWPWMMAAAFGLLHGLGFAGALREAGLPAGEIPLALFSFNVAIELGQVLFVLGVLGLGRIAGHLAVRIPEWATWVPVYAMGSLAGYWWLERALALLR